MLGYESVASVDILSKTPKAKVTPGMSISGAPGPTAAGGLASAAGSAGSTPASATSSGAGAAAPTVNAQLLFNAAAAAVGFVGIAML